MKWCPATFTVDGHCLLRFCSRRQLLLEFFAASGDFTRRLTSVKANSKFSSPFAGPEDYFSVSPPNRHAMQLTEHLLITGSISGCQCALQPGLCVHDESAMPAAHRVFFSKVWSTLHHLLPLSD